MPFIPGLFATPTVIANALLSFARDGSVPVHGPDRVGVVSPMFNEEAGAAAALASLLAQSVPFDELAVSVNGGSDSTSEVVRRTLGDHGYREASRGHVPGATATYERWFLAGGPAVAVIEHAQPISKSDSINVVLEGGLLNADRVLVVDGDTVLDEDFLAGLRSNFYRLHRRGRGARTGYVVEDYAVQSGAVMSARPGQGQPAAGFIHRARSAEYAIATVLRSGQTARVGSGGVFGNSRLYTVVGCGFTARRECFPMPSGTLTEDHDFTLAVQNAVVTEEATTPAGLTERGFRAVVAGEEVALEDLVPSAEVTLRRGGNARFITESVMYTDDPVSLPGYLRQIERWNGGGVENGLKRFFVPATWRTLRASVRFTLLAAHFENVFGLLLLLLALPLALGLNFALPGHGTPLGALLIWFGIDLAATAVLALLGFRRLGRGLGLRGPRLARWSGWQTFRSALPLTLLRGFNAVTFVTGAARAIWRFANRHEIDPRVTITWERPRASTAKRAQLRFLAATSGLLSVAAAVFGLTAWVADGTRPGYRDAWRLINDSVPVLQTEHQRLPLPLAGSRLLDAVVEAGFTRVPETQSAAAAPRADQAAAAPDTAASAGPAAPHDPIAALVGDDLLTSPLAALGLRVVAAGNGTGVSEFCAAQHVVRSDGRRRALTGEGVEYAPLSPWGLLVLARLAPLVANLEEAATAYRIEPGLLLRVLLNESYLDPLAIGPTGDLGLAQVTSDALTLLRAISVDPLSPYANPRLFDGTFSVFDPDFSICAGAAKLAWAQGQPGGDDEQLAYARYINPLEGVVRGKVSQRHAELVVAIEALKPLARALGATVEAYRADPASVTDQERAILGVTGLVADGTLNVAQAYFVTAELVRTFGINDQALFDSVRQRLYGDPGATPGQPVPAEQG